MILSEESAVEPSDKRCECKRLLLLAKVDVMLARMTESRTGQYLGYLVEATKCYRQIWKVSSKPCARRYTNIFSFSSKKKS